MKRNDKNSNISDGELRFEVAEKLYSKMTYIMRCYHDAAKFNFYLDSGYILSDQKHPVM